MPNKPIIHQSHIVAQSRLFCIEAVDLEFSNGTHCQYERLKSRGHGAVLVVPMLDDDTVLMIREYSVGVESYELCLPKGKMDAGESISDAANREMQEEVGYIGEKLTHLDSLSLAPSYFEHKTHIVLAQGLQPSQLEGDEPEPLEIVPCKLSELNAVIARSDCTEARTIAALFMVKEYLHS